MTLASTQYYAQRLIQWLEPLWLIAMVIAYWYHSPPIRDEWVWLIWGILPITALRWLAWRRLWTGQAFLWLCVGFILLTIFNYETAPYARADYWVLMVRPLMGISLVIYCVEHVRQHQTMMPLLLITTTVGAIVTWLGLTATQWTVKSEALMPIIDALPTMDYRTLAPDMLLSFNVNEIGGALTWLVPFLIGLAIAPLPVRWRALRYLAGLIGVGALIALFLGQSRFAIAGVLGALVVIVTLLLHGRWRIVGIVITCLLIAFQANLTFDLFTSPDPSASTLSDTRLLSDRDESTLNQRTEIWQRTLSMITDYPFTGVGMSMFYLAVRHEPYIVTQLANRPPPHAHNALLQIGADLGIMGMLIWFAWHAVTGVYLWCVWRQDTPLQRHLAVVIAMSIGAHLAFGIGDAIKLWDRYAFLWWWMIGLACAIYFQAQNPNKTKGK